MTALKQIYEDLKQCRINDVIRIPELWTGNAGNNAGSPIKVRYSRFLGEKISAILNKEKKPGLPKDKTRHAVIYNMLVRFFTA